MNFMQSSQLWQGEHVHCIMPPRRIELLSGHASKIGIAEESWNGQVVSRNHRNILLPIDRIGNRADRNRAADHLFPQNLSRIGVEGSQAAIEVAPEDEIASR